MGIGRRSARMLGFTVATLLAAAPALAFDFAGTKTVSVHGRDGQAVPIGSVRFQPVAGGSRFELQLDHRRLQDYFLSMKEFKCLASAAEVLCHVPYPYASPRTVSGGDLRWLEHELLFFFKAPRDFGARLWNGIYFQLAETPDRLVGTPQAIDLNAIGAPPDDLSVPPYDPAQRGEIDPATRWFNRLTIE